MYCLALIGDLVHSREAKNRGALQKQLQATLASLNERHREELLSPLTLTLGDEFQALFSRADGLWRVVAQLQAALHPVEVRFGFGLGEIVTEINPDEALGMDGPAFHRARDAITQAREEEIHYRIQGLAEGDLANHSLALVSRLQGKWKQHRFRVLARYLEREPVADIAKALNISQVAVYKNIHDGYLETLEGIMEDIARGMDRQLEGTHAN